MQFSINPETGLPHIYDHNVQEYEVEDVLAEPHEDRPSRENTRQAIGQTWGGRYLRVIYKEDAETGRVLVITAYDLRGNALRAFRSRRRKKGG